MNKPLLKATLLALVSIAVPSYSSSVINHYDMTRAAVQGSILMRDSNVLLNLGLVKPQEILFPSTAGTNTNELKADCRHGDSFQIVKLIGCGAQFEDVPVQRVLNHFFDPANNGRKLTFPLVQQVANTMRWPFENSPDWMLEDIHDVAGQDFSYKDARSAFFKALTTKGTEKDRYVEWGRLFQTIGHVVHHAQDMAQPQHVRNDQHLTLPVPLVFNPSLYESYTERRRAQIERHFVVPAAEAVYTTDVPHGFKVPRDFWANSDGTGLAQITNTNFLSAGTNFKLLDNQQVVLNNYALPAVGIPGEVALTAADLTAETAAFCGSNCVMTFYSVNEGKPTYNARGSALSIFDEDVRVRPLDIPYTGPGGADSYNADRIFTLNRFTMDAAHAQLIPAAVSYSTGLINYFFRGSMEITPPDEAIYGVVDHAVENSKTEGGFRKIKLKVKNTTKRGADIEPMYASGKLTLVAKFRRNNCYLPDLSGEYGSPGMSVLACRDLEEEIVVSEPIDANAGMNNAPQDATFVFTTPIPINASDLYLQVIYRGQLGDELDAVVVAKKDISEPTFLVYWDDVDQMRYSYNAYLDTLYLDPAGGTWYDAYCSTDPNCKATARRTLKLRFGPPYDQANLAAFQPIVKNSDLPVGSYSRFAVLGDPGTFLPVMGSSEYPGQNPGVISSYCAGECSFRLTVQQMDPVANTMTVVTYAKGRGIFASVANNQHAMLTAGTNSNPPAFVPAPVPLQIEF